MITDAPLASPRVWEGKLTRGAIYPDPMAITDHYPGPGPRPRNSSFRVSDIEVGRLITLTSLGVAHWNDTRAPVIKPCSLRVLGVIHLRGAAASLVSGLVVRNNGTVAGVKKPREVVVQEGSFVVWW